MMRKQYYFKQSAHGLLAWDVDRLIALSRAFPRRSVGLSQIRELDQEWAGDDERHTWRAMLEHVRLIDEADLAYPIILSADGSVMDGMHRVMKASLQRRNAIEAVQFEHDPDPDYTGKGPGELPY